MRDTIVNSDLLKHLYSPLSRPLSHHHHNHPSYHGRMALATWRLPLVSIICVTLLVSGTTGDQAADPKLHVFSSLQKETSEQAPPYPVGMELSLTCVTAGNRKTYWYEKKESNEPERLQSENGIEPGTHWSLYNIPRLEKSDHGRELMCMKDSSTMQEDVNLDVVDKPSPADISSSFDAEVKADLLCVIEGLSSHLELCWYEEDKELQCQVPDITSPTTETSVTVQVLLPELLEKNHTYLCKPKLRSEANAESLTNATMMHFAAMFAEVSKELKMVPQGVVDCDATREPVGEEMVVTKSEKDNTKSCYKVAISENKVALPEHKEALSEHKEAFSEHKEALPDQGLSPPITPQANESGNKRSTPSGTTTPVPDSRAARSVATTTVLARACPHHIAVLLLLALTAV